MDIMAQINVNVFHIPKARDFDKEGTKFLCGKVLLSIDASNLLNFHRTKSTFCISRGQKYSSLCWFKNLTQGCNIEEEMSFLSSVPSCH